MNKYSAIPKPSSIKHSINTSTPIENNIFVFYLFFIEVTKIAPISIIHAMVKT